MTVTLTFAIANITNPRYLVHEISLQSRWPNYPADSTHMGPPKAAEYAAMLPPLVAAIKNASNVYLKLLAVAGESTEPLASPVL